MPGGDRTGPAGAGPRTGRGAGYCSGSDLPGSSSPEVGFGRGQAGRGSRRGWRHTYYATGLPRWARSAAVGPTPAPDQERTTLRSQVVGLRRLLEALLQRLGEIEKH
jgi:hypothetical protein